MLHTDDSSVASAIECALAVSVVMPVYNAQDYLRACLDSLLSQTLHDIEVVCVNDGSTDSSLEILREYERDDSRVVVIDQPNQGAASARNRGIGVARGEYLAILDSDDFFEPDMLEKAHARAKATDADIVVFRSDTYYIETGEHAPTPWTLRSEMLPADEPFAGTDIEKDAFKVFVGWSWDKLFKASFIRDTCLEFQPLRTSNDMKFVFCAIARAERIATLQDVLVHHRRGVGGLAETREQSWTCFHDALMAIRAQLEEWGLFDHYERDFVNYCLHASLWNYETLKEPTRSLLRERLVDEWFDEFGVAGRDAGYFYNKGEARKRDLLMACASPKVSVVIPSLNSADYYDECIVSALRQDLLEIEVICVDAGSDDGTRDIIAKHMKKDPRVRLLDSEMRSYGHQMNLGIDAARGKYLFVLESDDCIEPGTLSYYFDIAEEHGLDFVKSDHAQFWDDGGHRELKRRRLSDSPAYYNRVWNPSETPGLMHLTNLMQPGVYRLDFIRANDIKLNESPGASYQDNGFWYQVFSQAERAMFTDRVCYLLRRDNPNSSVNSTGKALAICDEYAFIRETLKRRGREDFLKMCAQSYYGNCVWTMKRIGEWFLPQFLERMAADFRELEAEGQLDRRYFSARQWNTMHEVMMHGGDFYHLEWHFRQRLEKQREKVVHLRLRTRAARRETCKMKKDMSRVERSGLARLGRVLDRAFGRERGASRDGDFQEEVVKWEEARAERESARADAAYRHYSTLSDDELAAQVRRAYAGLVGADVDLGNPSSYNEKVLAYRVSGRHREEKARLLDKLAARDFVAERVGPDHVAPILGVWEDFEAIDLGSLPIPFVLECSHGRDMAIAVEGKEDLDASRARDEFDRWLSRDFAFEEPLQLEYRGIPARIIARALRKGDAAAQYRIWCFDGAARLVQVLSEEGGETRSSFFDLGWVAQPFRYSVPYHDRILERPDRLDEMVEVAERLAKGFDHVIIGLTANPGENVLFEEAFFAPSDGYCAWSPPEANFELGELFGPRER